MLPSNVLYYGRPQPLPQQIPLRAGPLSLIYEAGDLRYIGLGDVEILRRVYAAVRDHNWGTVPPELSNEQVWSGPDSFKITFDVRNHQNDIDFAWQGEIIGESDGTITYTMRGEARSTFRRNRIGFCVLHPMDCAGAPVQIEHDEGTMEDSAFPVLIAPQVVKDGHPWPVAPFDHLRALSHQVLPDIWAEVRFTGDVFEMEDQRNWTDASFKTYCTPLSLPFPAEITAGTVIDQSVRLSLRGRVPERTPAAGGDVVTLTVDDRSPLAMPAVGLGAASHGQPLTQAEIERLKALRLSHLRVDLTLSDPNFKARLSQAAEEARSLGVHLEIALFLSDSAAAELAALQAALRKTRPPVLRWLIFHRKEKTTCAQWVYMARNALAAYDPNAQIGAGSNAYFTEINAVRPPLEALDFITYSINPQVHAFDNASLTETLACQAVTVASAKSFSQGKPVVVSPVTLQPRFNPNATGPQPELAPGELPAQVDPRQSSLYGLAWTLGSIKYLAQSGAVSLTYYETSGWRGVLEQQDGSPLPQQFFSLPGGVYPLYHLFADLAEMPGAQVLPLQSSQPLRVDGLALEDERTRMLLLANFTAQPQTVRLDGLPASPRLRRINETNAIEAMQEPEAFREKVFHNCAPQDGTLHLELLPFETVRINIKRPADRA
jgi:D-apionolactonase